MKRVYIAGKLNDMAVGYLYNVHRMMEVAEEARKAGYAPFVPAIDLLMGVKFGYDDYHNYFDMGQPWLEAADAVLLVPGFETSEGTFRELHTALNNKIPIYTTLEDMRNNSNRVKNVVQDINKDNFKFTVIC